MFIAELILVIINLGLGFCWYFSRVWIKYFKPQFRTLLNLVWSPLVDYNLQGMQPYESKYIWIFPILSHPICYLCIAEFYLEKEGNAFYLFHTITWNFQLTLKKLPENWSYS